MRYKLSPCDAFPKRRLVVDTETLGTEISVIDSKGDVVARAATRLDQELPPAHYRIQYQIGDRVVTSPVELSPGGDASYAAVPELPIASALPMPPTGLDPMSDDPEWARARKLAEELSVSVPRRLGKDGFLFVFVTADRHVDAPEHPATGLTLHTFWGELLVDFANEHAEAGCTGCRLELDPGNYLIRAKIDSDNPVEQTVVVCRDWQTEVFIRLANRGRSAPAAESSPEHAPAESSRSIEWQFDLSGMGVILVRPHSRPTVTDMRQTAAARQALAAGNGNAAPDRVIMQAFLSGKSENPMLGIYAGHMLALQIEPDLVLLREIYENLSGLVGQHPDVSALLIALRDPGVKELRYHEPPMLRTSWYLLVNASTAQRDLRPRRSYSERIAPYLWGSGVWLSWRMPPLKHPVVIPSLIPSGVGERCVVWQASPATGFSPGFQRKAEGAFDGRASPGQLSLHGV